MSVKRHQQMMKFSTFHVCHSAEKRLGFSISARSCEVDPALSCTFDAVIFSMTPFDSSPALTQGTFAISLLNLMVKRVWIMEDCSGNGNMLICHFLGLCANNNEGWTEKLFAL
jgi:hypothetical protein